MAIDGWLLDATISTPEDGAYCFVPYNDAEGIIVLGMNVISDRPPGRLIGVYHAEGQAAAEAWYNEHWAEVDTLSNAVTDAPRAEGPDEP